MSRLRIYKRNEETRPRIRRRKSSNYYHTFLTKKKMNQFKWTCLKYLADKCRECPIWYPTSSPNWQFRAFATILATETTANLLGSVHKMGVMFSSRRNWGICELFPANKGKLKHQQHWKMNDWHSAKKIQVVFNHIGKWTEAHERN
jgi:hypothetical protein